MDKKVTITNSYQDNFYERRKNNLCDFIFGIEILLYENVQKLNINFNKYPSKMNIIQWVTKVRVIPS